VKSRRKFLHALGAGALAGALPAAAQRAPFRIAWVSPTRASEASPFLDALRRGLQELGYVEGRNLVIEVRWGDDAAATMEQRTTQLVALRPDVIVTQGASAVAVHRLTATIPVVFGYSGDPVEAGFVESLARPGRNLTGISFLTLELVGKRVELLKEALPHVKRLAVVANPQHAGDQAERRASQTAAAVLGLALEYFEARNAAQLDDALAAIEKSRSDAVMLFPVALIISHRERIAAWAIKHRLPTISGWAQFAEGGNLMSYGPNLLESYRRLAAYVDRILKGAKPSDLPVELPTRVELVLNLKAARALGVTVPPTVLLRADRVIE